MLWPRGAADCSRPAGRTPLSSAHLPQAPVLKATLAGLTQRAPSPPRGCLPNSLHNRAHGGLEKWGVQRSPSALKRVWGSGHLMAWRTPHRGEAAPGEPLCWLATRLVGHAAGREPGLSGSCAPPALGQGSPQTLSPLPPASPSSGRTAGGPRRRGVHHPVHKG